jgi:hypothetical protein
MDTIHDFISPAIEQNKKNMKPESADILQELLQQRQCCQSAIMQIDLLESMAKPPTDASMFYMALKKLQLLHRRMAAQPSTRSHLMRYQLMLYCEQHHAQRPFNGRNVHSEPLSSWRNLQCITCNKIAALALVINRSNTCVLHGLNVKFRVATVLTAGEQATPCTCT